MKLMFAIVIMFVVTSFSINYMINQDVTRAQNFDVTATVPLTEDNNYMHVVQAVSYTDMGSMPSDIQPSGGYRIIQGAYNTGVQP